MLNNDLTGEYLKEREKGQISPYDELMGAGQSEPNKTKEPMEVNPGGFVSDVIGGVVEAPRQIVAGAYDAVREMGEGLEGITESLIGETPVVQLIDPETGDWDLDLLSKQAFAEKGGEQIADALTGEEARTTTGGVVRSVSQFLTAFLPASKMIGGVQTVKKAAAAGAMADLAAFDGKEDRLSNLVESIPELQNPVTEFLAAKPGDTELEGRLKNAIEGLGLGALADGLFYAVKGIRANRASKIKSGKEAAEKAQIEKLADIDVKEGEIMPKESTLLATEEELMPSFKVGSKKAGKEGAKNINLANVNTTEEVEDLINGVAEVEAKNINKARREVITHEETEKLASDLGLTVDDLLARRKGEAFNAEQAVAARKILVSSGENLVTLAKKAATGSDQDVIIFRKALSQHSAIQAQVSGLTAEAGRALQSFRIQAKSAADQERLISEALEASGGVGRSKQLASKLGQLEGTTKINTFVKQAMGAKTKDMVYEAWINGLLSSPATHTVNVLSNALVAGWSVGERKVASMIGQALTDQGIPKGEASAQLWGMVQGAKDGFALAWHAIKTGEPSDPLQKIEMLEHRAITAENLNLSGTAGRFADFMGETVRTPGRMLTAGDELFKSIGYRMELNAQAFRTAAGEGLDGDAMAARMTDIINNPPENIELSAIDAQRYQTFTRELGPIGKAVQGTVHQIPGARVIVPFLRTPTNIVKYVGERTPLAPLSSAVRSEIKAGGARRDLALAKIATGSMVMAVSADYAMSGNITGGGPKNPQMMSALRATGWQPYSIKVNDTYYSYSRLDPIGALIGLSADITEIMGQATEADALDMATAATIATAQNVTSKTYLSGVSQFFDVMSSTSADVEANNKKAQRWIERLAGSVVPAGVAQAERMVSPELSATQGIVEKIRSRIPGYSDDLPPRRNIFGEPIVLSGGLGPDIMSPIYTSTDKKDPIADEIVDQQALIRMPLKTVKGVELDTMLYDEYVRLYSGENNSFVSGKPLKIALKELFNSDLYQSGTSGQDGSKALMIQSQFQAYKQTAQQQLIMNHPELEIKIKANQQQKAEKLGQ